MPIPPRPGRVLVEVAETGSTNDDARALAEGGAPHGAAVLAARQTRGRGRAGRTFASPDGGLYLSVVLRPQRPPAEWGLLALATGLAVVEALRARGAAASLKWPNDVLVGEGKLAGILVESRWGREPFAVAGIGVNLAEAPVPGATSLRAQGIGVERRALAEGIVERLLAVVARWEAEGKARLLEDVRAVCATLGKRVEWEGGEGVAVDVGEDGALVVDVAGELRRLLAGDVHLRR